MVDKTRIMLYVNNVDQVSQFWQTKFGAPIVSTTNMPDGSTNVVLAISDQVEFSLFSREFIKQSSPEVLGTTVPSLMLFIDNFEDAHKKLDHVGKIIDDFGTLTFNFNDPEGNYFVVAKS